MKKILFAFLGLVVLSGCSSYYDYYKGGVRYTQDGDDCIYYAAERGRHYSNDIRALDVDKKIVYKNTMCRDLYVGDAMGVPSESKRQILAPATKSCGCAKKQCGKKRYVFVK